MLMTNLGSKIPNLLDVITPTLNIANYIENCLLSTKALGCLANHIVVDSGSTDGTLEKVRLAGVNSVYHPPGNMYAAINRGIAETDSKWVTYLNADDIVYPNEIKNVLENIADDCDVVYGNIDYIDSEGRFLHHWKSAQSENFAGLFAKNIMPFPQQGAIFRRSLWEKLSGFDERYKYAADFDFFLRAFAQGAKFHYYDRMPVAGFRLHSNQISQNHADSMFEEGRRSFKKSALGVNRYQIIRAIAGMRLRNINGYLSRILRYHHLYGKMRIIKSI